MLTITRQIDRADGDTARSRGVLVLVSDGVCGPASSPLAPFLSRAWPPSGLVFIGATLFMAQLPRLFIFSLSSFPSHTLSPLCHEPVFSPNIRGWRDSLPWLDQGHPPTGSHWQRRQTWWYCIYYFFHVFAHWLPALRCCPKGKSFVWNFPRLVCLTLRLCLFLTLCLFVSSPAEVTSFAIAYTRAPVAGHVIEARTGRADNPTIPTLPGSHRRGRLVTLLSTLLLSFHFPFLAYSANLEASELSLCKEYRQRSACPRFRPPVVPELGLLAGRPTMSTVQCSG
ncbi:hypothetical protein V8F20_001303 [Naviculisporaceae sp. PSN 640]